MAIRRKVYRFRLRPTKAQEPTLNRLAGARRWVWNWALRRWKDHYTATGTSIGIARLTAELPALKREPETAWLKEASAQALQQTLRDLQRAFTNFFEGRASYPKFKGRKRDRLRFHCPQHVRVVAGKVYVPKLGWVRIRQSQPVELPTKGATFKRDTLGHWYVTLIAELEMPDVPIPPPDPGKVIGVDLGLRDFAVLSDGTRVASPKFYRRAQHQLRRASRIFARRAAGSRRKMKAQRAIARVERKAANRRNDFLHKLSTSLVQTHAGLCIEDLALRGLARTKLAKSFYDASLGEFRRQLTYKSEWSRKHLAVIGRFFPSSKKCRACGAINNELTLSDRHWVCGCGAVHDRDLNAARNIRDEGLRMLAAGHAESRNARGRDVRLPTGSRPG